MCPREPVQRERTLSEGRIIIIHAVELILPIVCRIFLVIPIFCIVIKRVCGERVGGRDGNFDALDIGDLVGGRSCCGLFMRVDVSYTRSPMFAHQ